MGYSSMNPMMKQRAGIASAGAACIAVLLCMAAELDAQAAPAQSPVGPLGHWKCDDAATPGKVIDASGNGFHGTCSAGATISDAVPTTKFPNTGCLTLDGVSGIVTIPDAPVLRITGDITIAFWKRKTANNKDWTRIVGKGNGGQRNFGVWEYPEGDGRLKFQIYSTAGGSVLELDTPAALPINAWSHVVCAISVNAAAIYVNGVLVGNAARTGDPGVSADPVTFGHAGYHGFWAGQLDDIRLYNRALSMSEIVYLAAGHGPPAAPTGLAAVSGTTPQAALKWTASTTVPPAGTATFYVVKRSTTPGKEYTIVASGMTGTTHVDLQAEVGKTYSYIVTAINSGGESAPSNELTLVPRPK
jgi:hypothetical protein